MATEDPAAGEERGEDDFADRLAELKAQGSTVLVTGSGAGEGHADLCRRLMGADATEPRHRLLVVTNGTSGLQSRLPPSGPVQSDTTVISASATRSAAAVVAGDGVDVVDLADASLDELGVAITKAVRRTERRRGPLAPAELRVGVDALGPLLDGHGEQDVFAFLVLAVRYLKSVEALGHFHLGVDRDAYAARLLAPLFDVLVEVRSRNGQRQQRWHVDDGAITSRWLPL